MGFTVRSACPRTRRNILLVSVAGVTAAGLVGLVHTPATPVSRDQREISDCLGREDGYDRTPLLNNKEWARAENRSLGYGRYATCRFTITHDSRYVDFGQRAVSDTYGACDGPAWSVELIVNESVARSKATTWERERTRRKERSIERNVSGTITAAIADVLDVSLGRNATLGRREETEQRKMRGDTTAWTDSKTDEKKSIVGMPEGKRVYLQSAPWLQKSSGYLEMSYWEGESGGRSRAVKKIDLTTHTPVLREGKKPRMDYQTRWMACPKKK
ncbi:hypothetical protein GO001_25345 [Streptomyces sp. NRRL B-1677]|uniref:Uncharacterized protein n=1 Tax=Streptomyces klenkii TaxID=1420899 RepID=A0A3B0BZD4_9ACTN|nr:MULTISPECIES: hypothetical protein [Streptomyces]MBF6048492.1 hypothetical protein [Streptomyces sp. NRRL B-1677]RKN77618.1 hypothetical protein D7231_02645 [Streptomyces klenkii]